MVILLFQRAQYSGAAAVADIRRFFQTGTVVRHKVRAESVANTTGFAMLVMAVKFTGMTDFAFLAFEAIGTSVVFDPETANGFDGEMGFHLLGNGGRVFVKKRSDFLKRGTITEFRFDRNAIGLSKMFIIWHGTPPIAGIQQQQCSRFAKVISTIEFASLSSR